MNFAIGKLDLQKINARRVSCKSLIEISISLNTIK